MCYFSVPIPGKSLVDGSIKKSDFGFPEPTYSTEVSFKVSHFLLFQVGDEITVQVCFADSPSNSCYYHNEVTVTKCPGDFYVYFLESTPQCDLRYCAASDK